MTAAPGSCPASRAAFHICGSESCVWRGEFPSCPILQKPWARCAAGGGLLPAIASRPVEWDKVGVRRVPENLGPAGVTLAFVRDDLLNRCQRPSAPVRSITKRGQQPVHVQHPAHIWHLHGWPGWYSSGSLDQGGVAAMEQLAIAKIHALYAAIDASLLRKQSMQNRRSRCA